MTEDHGDADSHITPLDESHTLSEKQAVMRMLGYQGGFEFGEGDDAFEYNLNDYLYDLQDAAYGEYQDARLERHELLALSTELEETSAELAEVDKKIEEKKAARLQTQDLVRTAEHYLNIVKDEVLKATLGQESFLIIDPEESANNRCTHITKASFEKWREANAKRLGTIPRPPSLDTAIAGRPGSLTATKAGHLFATFGLLVHAFSKTARKYQNGNKPNVSAIAERLMTDAGEANNGESLPGQSDEAIKDRIEEALKKLTAKLPGGRS